METHWLIQTGFSNAAGAVLLAAAVFLVSRRLRRPALTHALWVLVLVKFLTPPLIGVPVPGEWLPEEVAAVAHCCLPGEAGPSSSEEPPPPGASVPPVALSRSSTSVAAGPAVESTTAKRQAVPWRPTQGTTARGMAGAAVLPWVVLIWLSGSALYFLCVSVRTVHFAIRLRSGGCTEPAAQARAVELGRSFGLDSVPPVTFVAGPCSPMLWGFGPFVRLVFPTPLWNQLAPACRDALLTHELAHYQRRDHWVRPLEILATGLFWWHPAVWWARREIERAEESCCDAWVVRRSSVSPRTYAEALLAAVDYLSDRPAAVPAATGLGGVPDLKSRLEDIMRAGDAGTMPACGRWLLSAAVLTLPVHPFVAEPALAATITSRPIRVISAPNSMQDPVRPEPDADSPQYEHHAADGEPAAASGWWLVPPQDHWASVESPDGRFRLMVNTGNRVVAEDLATGRQTDLAAYELTAAAFTPDSRLFVAGERDGTVRVWNAEFAEPLSYLGPHDGEVVTVAVSPTGRFAVSGSRDGALVVWDLGSGVSLSTWTAPRQSIASVRIAAGGRLIAVATGDWLSGGPARLTLLALEEETLRPAGTLEVPTSVAAVEFTAGETALLAAAWDGTVFRWDLAGANAVPVGTIERSLANAARFSPDVRFGNRIARPHVPEPVLFEWTQYAKRSNAPGKPGG